MSSSPCDLYRNDGLSRKTERKPRLSMRVTRTVVRSSTLLPLTDAWTCFVSFRNLIHWRVDPSAPLAAYLQSLTTARMLERWRRGVQVLHPVAAVRLMIRLDIKLYDAVRRDLRILAQRCPINLAV